MIEKMECISLYGLTGDSRRMLDDLMKCGCVQISDPEQAPEYEAIKESVRRGTVDVYDSEQALSRLNLAIGALAPFAPKKSLFTPRREVSFDQMAQGKARREAMSLCDSVEAQQREISFLKGELSKQEFLISSLEPWKDLDQPLDRLETRSAQVILAVLPLEVSLEELVSDGEEAELGAYFAQISEDLQQRYLAAVCHREKASGVWDLLRQRGASRASFPGMKGTAAENMEACRSQMADLEESLKAAQGMLEGFGGQIDLLREAYDATQMAIETAKARQKMLHTEDTFFFQAWVPQRRKDQVERALAPYTCYYEFRPPEEGEDPPVLLKNNKLVEPFETVTEMYSLPAYNSLDPDPVMAPFYFIFFGMMLSDAGYGLILAIAGLWGAKKLEMGPGGKKMLKMLGYCGISTIFWGALYGSWFGDAIPKVAEVFFGKSFQMPMLIDPLGNPVAVLAIAFVFGYIHILVGLGVKMYLMIRRGHLLDALMDVGFWYLVLIGLPVMAAGMMLGGSLAALGTVGQWIAIVGAVGLVLTQGRDKKNPIVKLFSGLLSLYDITGYFSDLLSYSRIMALGLATAVIGQVVNLMGTLPGRSIFGALLFILVFLLGHTLNLAINALGSYVHTSRLQYVEFFGKFFESGGQAFSPLRPKPKYVNITTKQEEN